MLPSCVPATPFETSGACLTGEQTAALLQGDAFFGLGEFMNAPGVLGKDAEALQKAKGGLALHDYLGLLRVPLAFLLLGGLAVERLRKAET